MDMRPGTCTLKTSTFSSLDTKPTFQNFYQPERANGPKIVLRFPRLFVCLSVCASTLIMCAIYYVIRNYATTVHSSVWRLQAKLQQIKVVVCCLDGKNFVGSRKDPVFVAYSY